MLKTNDIWLNKVFIFLTFICWNHTHGTLIFIVIAHLIIFNSNIKNNISTIISPSRLNFFVWKSKELGYKLVWP